jgi:phage shock protein E
MSWKIFTQTSLLLITILSSVMTYADPTWINVRSEFEHRLDSIDGDVRISHTEIVQEVSKRFPDKSTEIKLYCLSGGRAGKAMSALEQAGYNNISNAGGISDAREQRGLQ